MTRTIAMSQKELNRKTIIEQAVEGRITQKKGAEKVGISERRFRRLLGVHLPPAGKFLDVPLWSHTEITRNNYSSARSP